MSESVPLTAVRLPRPAVVRSRRNPKWIALGIVALCLGALGSFFLYTQLADAHDVVALKQTVYRGDTLTAADLTTVRVGTTPGIGTVPASDLNSLVGQQASVDLLTGTMLAPGSVTRRVVPQSGHSVVGVKLSAGRAPNGFLRPSSPIRLIAIPPTGAAAGFKDQYSDLSIEATVIDTSPAADDQSVVMNVDVESGQASRAALLAAQERLVAVLDPER